MCTVREALVHAGGVEVPYWRPAHDPHAKRAEDGKVDGCVCLLHEAGELVALPDAEPQSNGLDKPLHEELPGEGEDDGVEADEGEVQRALAVLRDIADVCREGVRAFIERRVGVGEVEGVVERILLARVNVVGREQD